MTERLIKALEALQDQNRTFNEAVNPGPERDELNAAWKEFLQSRVLSRNQTPP